MLYEGMLRVRVRVREEVERDIRENIIYEHGDGRQYWRKYINRHMWGVIFFLSYYPPPPPSYMRVGIYERGNMFSLILTPTSTLTPTTIYEEGEINERKHITPI